MHTEASGGHSLCPERNLHPCAAPLPGDKPQGSAQADRLDGDTETWELPCAAAGIFWGGLEPDKK